MARLATQIVLGAGALTAFYLAHEQLPRSIRAPTSVLLSHIAIASGLLGRSGIDVYGNLPIVILLNLFASAFLVVAWNAWRRRIRGRPARK